MFISRIKPSELMKSRLEAEYYDPIKISELKWIPNWEKRGAELIDLCDFITDGTHQTPNYVKQGEVFLSGKNIMDGWIDPAKTKFITSEDLTLLNKNKCVPILGDILMSKNGKIGTAAVYQKHHPKCGLFVSVALLRHNSENDSQYISALINSRLGFSQFIRSSKTGVITNLHLEEIREAFIPLPNKMVQVYIGNKFRQAELLRQWANRLENRADQIIKSEFIWQSVSTMTDRPRRIASRFVSASSLGPEFNRSAEGQSLFKNSCQLREVIKLCKCGDPIRSDERKMGEYDYYGASGPIDKHNDYNFDGTFIIVAQDGSIGCASVSRGKIWANNHVWVLTVNDGCDADSIARYLNHHFPYWKGATTGSVIPKVTSENLLNLKIPIKVAKNVEAGNLLRLTTLARLLAGSLTEAAKLLVESLIEGDVTETELIAAQKDLANDDNATDKAILCSLTDKGYAVKEGKPLFSDLDALYELLDESQEDKDQD